MQARERDQRKKFSDRNRLSARRKDAVLTTECRGQHCVFWLRKLPAMPVEVSRKKALASSIERSESRTTIKQIRMHSIKTANARLRAAGHLMQVKNHSVHL